MAKLQPMRYKNYVWPHNPRSYSITYHRRLTAREYDRVLDWLDCMGIENGFVQELSSAKEEYTPDFSLQGV